jgi:hypothetical protein
MGYGDTDTCEHLRQVGERGEGAIPREAPVIIASLPSSGL